MPMYIFTYNQQDNSFPERYRVVLPEDDAGFLLMCRCSYLIIAD